MSKELYFYCNCGLAIAVKKKRDWIKGIKQEVLCNECKKHGRYSIMEEVFPEDRPIRVLGFAKHHGSTARYVYSKEKVEIHKKNMELILKECRRYLLEELKKEFPLGWQGITRQPTQAYFDLMFADGDYMRHYQKAREKGKKEIGGLVIEGHPLSSCFVVCLFCMGFLILGCDYSTSLNDATTIAKKQLRELVKEAHKDAVEREIYWQTSWWNRLKRCFTETLEER